MYLEHRDNGFPRLINEKNYKVGVEVGVRDGGYSKRLLNSNIQKLYGLDRFFKEEQHHFNTAKSLEIDKRYKLIVGESPQSTYLFENNYFDFIHIDAGHSYNDVKEDLEAWWPKLKTGGCFSGDDYITFYNSMEGEYGVVLAVEEFALKNKLEIFLTGLKECSLTNRMLFAKKQGIELTKKIANLPNNFNQTPNWYLFKKEN